MRKTASLTSFITFVCLVISSIVLFVVPKGRIAYWADWKFLYLTKDQWVSVHVNLGILFIISLCFHIWFNWKAVLAYLKNKSREFKLFTKEFNFSIAVVLVFIFGTIADIPFFSSITDLSDSIKYRAAVKYGEPPYGHAELSTLEGFSKRMNLNKGECIILLRNKGFEIHDENATLKEIAGFNKTSPKNIYLALKQAGSQSPGFKGMSGSSFSGKGRMKLSSVAKEYNLDPEELSLYLKKRNLKSDMNLTVRENAELNNMRPSEFFNIAVSFSSGKE